MPPSFKDAGDYRPRLFVHTNQLRPGELLELAPRLGALSTSATPIGAISSIPRECPAPRIGISLVLWGEACRIVGRQMAVVILAVVSTEPQ